jgi:single-strand DNA-binding protein
MVSQQPGKGAPRTGGGNSLNKVMVIGNLGADPEMRFTPSGNPVTSFRIAAGRVFNSPEGERKEETEWFNVVTWNKTAELCNQFLTKGRKVYVEGRLQTRSWDGQDGQKHYKVEVIASQVLFLDRKPAASSGAEEKFVEGEGGDIEPQDIPF